MAELVYWDIVKSKDEDKKYSKIILTISYKESAGFVQIFSFGSPTIRFYDNREKKNGARTLKNEYVEFKNYMSKVLTKANKLKEDSEIKMLYILSEFEKFVESDKEYTNSIKGRPGWDVWATAYNKDAAKLYKTFKKINNIKKFSSMKDLMAVINA